MNVQSTLVAAQRNNARLLLKTGSHSACFQGQNATGKARLILNQQDAGTCIIGTRKIPQCLLRAGMWYCQLCLILDEQVAHKASTKSHSACLKA
jgi:hypothetical protein